MSKRAKIHLHEHFAGILEKKKDGFYFQYNADYLEQSNAEPISLTLPLQKEAFYSQKLFPFFFGLIPEGWFFDLESKILKIDPNDSYGMLLATCKDCVGAVSVIAIK